MSVPTAGDPDRSRNPRRIVVVGSYATGLTMKVDRIPGAGETLLGHGYRVDFGGKGSNQAVGCARLGTQVGFVARIGSDPFGDMALDLHRQEGIDTTFVRRSTDAPTGVGFIIVEEKRAELHRSRSGRERTSVAGRCSTGEPHRKICVHSADPTGNPRSRCTGGARAWAIRARNYHFEPCPCAPVASLGPFTD